jgi:hypothetical protein
MSDSVRESFEICEDIQQDGNEADSHFKDMRSRAGSKYEIS